MFWLRDKKNKTLEHILVSNINKHLALDRCVVLFFVLFLFFYSIKISKFALPGVMLKYERNQ